MAVFEDIKPGAALHALVVPKRHIRDIDHLRGQDVELIAHMEKVGRMICEDRGFKETRFGFHKPPFNSMFHLHLHVVGLPLKDKFMNNSKLGKALVSPSLVI